MKFGKNLVQVVEFSDPEWGPYWMNYKFLKKKINDIVTEQGGKKSHEETNMKTLKKSLAEVEFFRLLKSEMKKTNEFFKAEEELFKIRKSRVWEGFHLLKENYQNYDKSTWNRLSMACVKLYEDVLLLENFAIMNYCGFSKILKKHDKMTGFSTREAFMRNTMEQQSFTHHYFVIDMLKESEKLFTEIQNMKSAMPLQEEERIFIEAIRGLNYQASRLQAEENSSLYPVLEPMAEDDVSTLTVASKLFPKGNSQQEVEVEGQTAAEGLDAAADALADVARRTYLSQNSPNLNSAISWITNLTRSAAVSTSAGNDSPPSSHDDDDESKQYEEVDGSREKKRSSKMSNGNTTDEQDDKAKRARHSSI